MKRSPLVRTNAPAPPGSTGSQPGGLAQDQSTSQATYALSVPYQVQSQNRDALLNVIQDTSGIEVVNPAVQGSGRPPKILIASSKGSKSSTLQTLAQAARDRVQGAGSGWSLSVVEQSGGNGDPDPMPVTFGGFTGTQVAVGAGAVLAVGLLIANA